jgi:hypothetical protein
MRHIEIPKSTSPSVEWGGGRLCMTIFEVAEYTLTLKQYENGIFLDSHLKTNGS